MAGAAFDCRPITAALLVSKPRRDAYPLPVIFQNLRARPVASCLSVRLLAQLQIFEFHYQLWREKIRETHSHFRSHLFLVSTIDRVPPFALPTSLTAA
jgi:hypothetical protein